MGDEVDMVTSGWGTPIMQRRSTDLRTPNLKNDIDYFSGLICGHMKIFSITFLNFFPISGLDGDVHIDHIPGFLSAMN